MALSENQQLYQKILEMHSTRGYQQQEIASKLGITKRTVRNYLSKFRKGVPVEDVKENGRPTKLTDTVRKRIAAQLDKDNFSTSK